MQGIDEQRYTVLSLLLGLLTKSVLQMPLILLFGAKGGALATGLGYIVSVVFTIFIIKNMRSTPLNIYLDDLSLF